MTVPGRGGPVPIVALDVSAAADAERMVSLLGEECRFYKVGSELFAAEGPKVVERIRGGGGEVFLDLKLHDIPNTVGRASRAAAALGVSLMTVHAAGGRAMIEAAVDGAGDRCGVLAVTVLTSHTAHSLAETLGREHVVVLDEVLRLAELARLARAHGVVCSGEEAAAIRERLGEGLRTLVPGIRLAGGAAHDQSRVVTPEAAARAGATYIVLGRAVTGDPDPRAALRRVHEALASAGGDPGLAS